MAAVHRCSLSFSGVHAIYDEEKTGTLLTEKAVSWIQTNKEKAVAVSTAILELMVPADRLLCPLLETSILTSKTARSNKTPLARSFMT